MSPDEFDDAVKVGVGAVENIDADLLVFGEVGIGNTTPAAAVTAAVLGGHPGDWVGLGQACRARHSPTNAASSTMPSHESVMSPHSRHSGDSVAASWQRWPAQPWRPVIAGSRCCSTVSSPLRRSSLCISRALERSTMCGPGTDPPSPDTSGNSTRSGRNRCLRSIFDWVRGAVVAIPIVQAACAAVVEVATFEEFGLA